MFSLKEIFSKRETDNVIIQFIRYIFVGGAAFVADAGILWIMGKFTNYLIAAAVAFIAGLVVNYCLSKLFVFAGDEINKYIEFITYAVIGVIGLLITEVMMFVFTEKIGIYYMISKIITAAIVLIWNFAARKIILYRSVKK